MESSFTLRKPTVSDAEQICVLGNQLGYHSSTEQIAFQIAALLLRSDQGLWIAAAPEGKVVGSIHARLESSLITGDYVEIGSLIVEELARGIGIGKALVKRVEDWALEKKIGRLQVHSQIKRKEAHLFYEKLGYGLLKTSIVFTKKSPT